MCHDWLNDSGHSLLMTESEGSLRENFKLRPCRIDRAIAPEVNTVGRGLRFSRNDDRTVEEKLFERKSSIAGVYRFIHCRQNYVSELHLCITYPIKNTFLYEKKKEIVTASKRYFSILVWQLDGGVFRLWGRNVNAYRKQRVLQNSPNKRSFGERK